MQDRRHAHAAARITHDVLDGEVLAIDESTGAYFSMSGTAATVWVAIGSGRSLEQIAETVARHHDADVDRVRDDVAPFLESLLADGLVVTTDEAGDAPDLTGIPTGPWAAPELGKFTDMRDLLMFDPIHEVDATGWPNVRR